MIWIDVKLKAKLLLAKDVSNGLKLSQEIR